MSESKSVEDKVVEFARSVPGKVLDSIDHYEEAGAPHHDPRTPPYHTVIGTGEEAGTPENHAFFAPESCPVCIARRVLVDKEAQEQTIASWILGLEGTYREPHVGRVLRDILATVEHRPLDPPDKYPPREEAKAVEPRAFPHFEVKVETQFGEEIHLIRSGSCEIDDSLARFFDEDPLRPDISFPIPRIVYIKRIKP